MGTEIERTFLVTTAKLPPDLRGWIDIEQGYLSDKPLVRVRATRSQDIPDKKRGFVTIKGPGLMTRPEWEFEVTYEEACDMLLLAKWTVTKRRVVYRDTFNQVWEIDEFLGPHQGLWLAEIELRAEDQLITKPIWLGQEVTEDPSYTNIALAQNPAPGRTNQTRPETGPMRFNGDWTGAFIRGDDCIGYGQGLRMLLEAQPEPKEGQMNTVLILAMVAGLAETLQSANEHEGDKEARQIMLPFGQCQ